MDALTKLATKQHLTGELTKVALKMSDVEDNMGLYLDKKHHGKVREMIKKRRDKSFVLRHPVLTGVPTLGLAPAIARARAADRIKRELLRGDKGLRKAYDRVREREYAKDMEERRLDVDRERAMAPARAAASLGVAYVLAKQTKDK